MGAQTTMLSLSEPRESPRVNRAAARCDACAVRSAAICGSLGLDALEDLSRLGRKIQLHPGQALLWEGNEAVLVGNVIEGMLKLSTVTGAGREQIVGIVFPSDFIGRPFGKDSHQTVIALTPATVCVFSRAAFDSFASDHGDIERALLLRTLDELDRARRWMLLLGRMSAPERVASLLLEIVDRVGPGTPGEPIMLPLSRQQMADLLGLAIETVSRTMTRFEREGLIGLPGGRRVIVTDASALERIASG